MEKGGNNNRSKEKVTAHEKDIGQFEKPQRDYQKVFQELENTKVELEVRNEELLEIARDREAARRELWHLYEYAPVSIVNLSSKGIVKSANAAARKALAGGSDRKLKRHAFSNFVFPEDMGIYFQHMRQNKFTHFEMRLLDMKRNTIHVHCQASPRFEPEKALIGWQIAFFDISEQKRLEEISKLSKMQLSKQLAETEKVNEELSQYAYAVSHDLKTPLRAIRNYSNFLLEDLSGTLKEEQKGYLDGMMKALEEADALITDLLSFSRIGQSQLEAELADVPGIVKEIQSGLGFHPEVTIEIQPDGPPFFSDRTLLRQILQNLITNAVKFNTRNHKRVKIGWQEVSKDCIELFVSDNGIGIEAEYSEQIFQIFQRLHTSNDYPGTGIGLAIVKKSTDKLGGEVRLESTPGKGSIFYVRLPRQVKYTNNGGDPKYMI